MHMPEITADERGRRVFQIHKEKAVENAVEKIRMNLSQDWKLFSTSDVKMIEHMLGEAWIAMGKQKWQRIAFTLLTKNDIDAIIQIGRGIGREERPEKTAIGKVIEIMDKVR